MSKPRPASMAKAVSFQLEHKDHSTSTISGSNRNSSFSKGTVTSTTTTMTKLTTGRKGGASPGQKLFMRLQAVALGKG
jgi:hypothetical protein